MDSIYYPRFDRAVRALVEKGGMTHRQVASMLGMGDGALRSKRMGKMAVGVDEALRTAMALGVTVEDLFGVVAGRPEDGSVDYLPRGRRKAKGGGKPWV